MFESHERHQLVSDYFIGEKMSKRKPILWMHTELQKSMLVVAILLF